MERPVAVYWRQEASRVLQPTTHGGDDGDYLQADQDPAGELELVAPLRAPPSEVPPIAPKDLGRNVEGLKRHFQSSRPGVKVALNRRFNSRALKNRKSIVCGLSPGSVARR